MARRNIIERTNADVMVKFPGGFFQSVQASTPAIPASYDGKYICMIAVAVDTNLNETQMDSLETAIEDITGVHKAFCLIGPARIPLDRMPVDHDLKINIEGNFVVHPV